MDFNWPNIIVSLIFSVVGFGYFRYGKRLQAPVHMMTGAILMGYGYFVDSWWVNILIGAALCAVPFFIQF